MNATKGRRLSNVDASALGAGASSVGANLWSIVSWQELDGFQHGFVLHVADCNS
jgi:hypothetical protein